MAIQKVPRDPEHLEMLRLYAAIDPVEAVGAGLRDTERLDEFLARARASLEHSIATPSRMHGLRAQALFQATLVALGQFRLLIDEDAGDPYYDDNIGRLAPPDFRVVDNAGETLLIEVKSVPPGRSRAVWFQAGSPRSATFTANSKDRSTQRPARLRFA